MVNIVNLKMDRLTESTIRHRANKHGFRIQKQESGNYMVINDRPVVLFHSHSLRDVNEYLKEAMFYAAPSRRRWK